MSFENEELALVKQLYVNNGEYDFDNEKDAEKFAKDLLYHISEEYSSEGYYHKYKTLKSFIYTHHSDTIAYNLYEGEYE